MNRNYLPETWESNLHHLSRFEECGRMLEEANGGLRFSGTNQSDYPRFRHRFMLRYRELRQHRPDLLLHWLEATVEGQTKRYVRNAFSVIDPGEACDVVWTTLEEVYGREDLTIDNAMQLVRRPAKSIGHN